MVHDAAARKESRGLKQKAGELVRQARKLKGIEGTAQLAGKRQAEAARLEDLMVWEDPHRQGKMINVCIIAA